MTPEAGSNRLCLIRRSYATGKFRSAAAVRFALAIHVGSRDQLAYSTSKTILETKHRRCISTTLQEGALPVSHQRHKRRCDVDVCP